MEEKKLENLNQLIDDIRFIKSSIKKNTMGLKEVVYSPSIQITFLFTGVMIILFSLTYYFLISKYSGYENIPQLYRTILAIGVVVAVIIASIIKTTVYIFLKRIYPSENYIGLTLKLYDWGVLLAFFIIIGIICYLSVYFGLIGKPQYIVPVSCIGMGICFYIMTGLIFFLEIFFLGLWLIITGLISIPFIYKFPGSALLWLAFSSGIGYLFFPVLTQIVRYIKSKE